MLECPLFEVRYTCIAYSARLADSLQQVLIACYKPCDIFYFTIAWQQIIHSPERNENHAENIQSTQRNK